MCVAGFCVHWSLLQISLERETQNDAARKPKSQRQPQRRWTRNVRLVAILGKFEHKNLTLGQHQLVLACSNIMEVFPILAVLTRYLRLTSLIWPSRCACNKNQKNEREIQTELRLTIFKFVLHKLLVLYNKTQVFSATNTDTTGLNSFLICPPLQRQGRAEVNPLHCSVRKL